MTRDKDVEVSLESRAAVANNNKAFLFVSIHANSSYRKNAFGSESYFLSLNATDREARRLAYLENLVRSLHEEEGETALRILDFSKVRHIEIAGQQEFFALARLLRSPNRHISILGMSRALQRRLAAGRVMDILGENLQGDALSALTRAPAAETGAAPGCRSYVMGNTALILLSGVVDGEGLASLGFVECLQHTARDRVCILDFRNVSLLESSAIAELHPLITAQQASREGQILVSGAVANVRQMFRMSGLDQPVRFIDDHLLLETIAAEGGSGD